MFVSSLISTFLEDLDFATEEIYFASGFSVANKKSWNKDDKNTNLSLIYDLGHFKSKSRTADEFIWPTTDVILLTAGHSATIALTTFLVAKFYPYD